MRVPGFSAIKPPALKRLGIGLIAAIFLAANLPACGAVSAVLATPTPVPTNTPQFTRTPRPTKTPRPSPTDTEAPTDEPTQPPPPEPTQRQPSATPLADPVKVFYIDKNTKGPYGCGEQLVWMKTKIARTGNIAYDAEAALKLILYYHSQKIGDLYNPGYASNLSVKSIETNDSGVTIVNLQGTYTPTKDTCDGPRLRDQIKVTVKQFPNVINVSININGTPIQEVISRK